MTATPHPEPQRHVSDPHAAVRGRADTRWSGTPELGPVSRFDRQPPQDLTAEQSVLGGMLLSKDAIADVVEVLRPDDFYRPAHQTVYDCILDLYGRGELPTRSPSPPSCSAAVS